MLLLANRGASSTVTLSRETIKRDDVGPAPDHRPVRTALDRARGHRPRPLRRDAGRACGGDLERRRGGGVVDVRAGRRGRARRHPPPVPQPRAADVDRVRRRGLRRRRCSRSCGRRDTKRLRRQVQRRQASTTSSPRSHDEAACRSTSPTLATYVDHYPKDALPALEERQGRTKTPRSRPAWRTASSRSTSGACTSDAASRSARRRSGSSARATARSTTASARRRRAPRRVASTASAWTINGGSLTIDTGIHRPAARRSVPNTTKQQQEGPLCV